MKAHSVAYPGTVAETTSLLAEYGDAAKIVAGGTAFTILRRAGLLNPELIISLARLQEAPAIDSASNVARVGSMMRLRDMERGIFRTPAHRVIPSALGCVGNPRVRNVATLGGNLVEADPTSDLPAILIALEAYVELRSASSTRYVDMRKLYTDYFESVVAPDELLTRVDIPLGKAGWTGCYIKFLSRSREDRTCLGVAAFVHMEGDQVGGLEVVVVGAGPIPLRLESVGQAAVGNTFDAVLLEEIGEAYRSAADPVSDVRGSAEYRLRVLPSLIKRALVRAEQGFNDAVVV